MPLNDDVSMPILYDLAIAMAGETRPYPLASAVLQCLLSHTGCAGATVLLDPVPAGDGVHVIAEVYAAAGDPALRAMEGKQAAWPAHLLADQDGREPQESLPCSGTCRHTLAFVLPEIGYLLLFFREAPQHAASLRRLAPPILARFARNLRHDLESEANARALQESEARFRGMVESTADWFWEIDAHGVFTFSNQKVHALLGYGPDEVIGKTPFDLMPAPTGAAHAGRAFHDAIASRRPFSDIEKIALHRDGHEVRLESSGEPIVDAAGNHLGYRGADRDVTARKHAQDALLRAKEAAEASSHAKTLFLSSISHELRTPLNAILGHAQLLTMHGDLPESATSSAQEIVQAGNNLLALLSDVIELANLESGGADLHPEPLHLSNLLADCLAAHADAARQRRISLSCPDSCTPFRIVADRRALQEVLNHLVANAIKYNHDGGDVTLSCAARPDGRVRITVTDGGPGITLAQRAQLFVPFNRLGAEKGCVEGAGIGLAISRRLVEAMAGSIGVDSPAGGGSAFWIELPRAADAAADIARPPGRNRGLEGARILVAEDYAPNQAVLRLQLSALGCEADLADDGAIALEKLRQGGYDLILTDLNMPVMGGLELAHAVRSSEAGGEHRTPIICVTAADHANEGGRCREAGIDDVLTKPITIESLRGKLTQWLGHAPAPEAGALAPVATLDLGALYEVLGEASPEQGRMLIATFLQAARTGLDALAAAPSAAALAREMHKQKSSARTVGALRYATLAATVEQVAASAGEATDIQALIGDLRAALTEVDAAYADLEAAAQAPRPLAAHGAVLIVDDDPVVLQQMKPMLERLGVQDVLAADSGPAALQLVSARGGRVETLICDLNMPGMDGVELIRQFSRAGCRAGIVLMSGADEKVLNTVGKLADLQGLRVLGQIQKPATPEQITELLSRRMPPRAPTRSTGTRPQVSVQAIHDGIERDEFTIWFQPKVDARSLEPIGVEALARWERPGEGIVSPEVFIDVAEQEGLIGELSQVLVSKALMEGARIHDAGFALSVALNLSGLWLDDLQLPDFLLATTRAAGLRPADVVLEVTETGVLKELAIALDVLTRLRLKGFGLSIDDFGIGYSSFEQLDRIPFTEMKLDRRFVSKGSSDATARAILQGSLDMARRMALSTVAEGVETTADLELVRALGCDGVQGYLIAAPMPLDGLLAWLQARTRA